MTKEERHLWYDFLRNYPIRFSRQKVLGKYIADFYSAEAKLVIELDGSQHYDDSNTAKDKERTAFLEGYGLTVIRIPNNEVIRNFRGVCEYIDTALRQSLSQKSKDFWQLPLHKGAFGATLQPGKKEDPHSADPLILLHKENHQPGWWFQKALAMPSPAAAESLLGLSSQVQHFVDELIRRQITKTFSRSVVNQLQNSI